MRPGNFVQASAGGFRRDVVFDFGGEAEFAVGAKEASASEAVAFEQAIELDRRIETYSSKRPIGPCRGDLDCLMDVADLALKDERAYPDNVSSACAA